MLPEGGQTKSIITVFGFIGIFGGFFYGTSTDSQFHVKKPVFIRWQSTPYFKKIVLWTTWFNQKWPMKIGSDIFLNCEQPHCVLTPDKTEASSGDVFIFHARDIIHDDVPKRHSEKQLWVFMTMESPVHTYAKVRFLSSKNKFDFTLFDGKFNLTSDYTSDSDIPTPYGGFRKLNDKNRMQTNIDFSTKTRLALWLVSNCKANRRNSYVRELRRYMPIDQYGKCGKPDPCKYDAQCRRSMRGKYKFYLAFENSLCREYITEKFWQALEDGMVPIVMGASLQEYQKLAPPNSFLHVDNFTSPKALASFVNYIQGNEEVYQYYHKWRESYTTSGGNGGPSPWCVLCKMAHSGIPTKVYNISQYWDKHSQCQNG